MRLVLKLIAPAIFYLGYFLFRSPFARRSKAVHNFTMKVFRVAADNGSTRALSLYGNLLFYKGDGQQNRIQGGIYLERAATAGDSKAQYQMGRVYESGFENYFMPSPTKALAFYRLAAEQGHGLAISRLATIYQHGELSQPVDTAQYLYWQGQKA